MKVIIVDDSMTSRIMLKRAFENIVNEIHEFSSGIELIRNVNSISPDIITLDLDMPHMNGIEVLKRLKAMGINCKIIVCSSNSQKDTIIECCKNGATSFLVKPISIQRLIELIKEKPTTYFTN